MNSEQIVSITSQGQLTIPKAFRKQFGINRAVKAVVWLTGKRMIVEPKKDFWQLGGSLASKIKLTDAQLRKARRDFERHWPRPMPK